MPDNGLPDGWRQLPVRKLLSLHQSGTWGDEASDGNGVRVLRSTNLTRDGRLSLKDIAVRKVPARDRLKKAFQDGDVMLERSGGGPGQPVGRVARIRDLGEVYCGNFCQQLRADPSVCTPDFLFRALSQLYERGVTARLEHRTTGIRNLDFDGYLMQQVPVPTPDEQHRIAEVLDSIDAAVEKTEAVIAATERLRSALLGELLTRGVPGWHTEWKAVPGIGTIPACWEVARLGDVCEHITKGATPTTFGHAWADSTSGIPFLRSECVGEGQFVPAGLAYISPQAHDSMRRSVVRAGDILMTITGYVGRVCMLPGAYREANINQHIARIRIKVGAPLKNWFVYWALRHPRVQRLLAGEITGIAYAQIGLAQVQAILVPQPTVTEQDLIATAINGLQERIERERSARETLSTLKDATAAALLSGQVRCSSLREVPA